MLHPGTVGQHQVRPHRRQTVNTVFEHCWLFFFTMDIADRKAMVIAPESSDSQESNIYLNFLALGVLVVVVYFHKLQYKI